jgi:hypothetical protein
VRTRRLLTRFASPYLRLREREAATAAHLARLEADFEHERRRNAERLERLEDLVRELILAAESLRRSGVRREDDGGQ